MNTVVKIQPKDVGSIPYQEASFDIWDKKYRLTAKDGSPIDKTMDDTYKRVARALADVESEPSREQWYESFLWALRHGAIPAGRVTSNAGALEHKPATSTINCTVSGTIRDSMDDILKKVHEAGLTLKAGCGIGYEFSTLRPRGAYVSGAGAYTSGPLSFMDIYDKMCFTVSSAGGRRGAQMGTFDIGHPDALEFIRAKRENGRLRQFNLSLLVTDEFMKAVKSDGEWTLGVSLGTPGIRGRAAGSLRHREVRVARMAVHGGLCRERGRTGRLQDLQDLAGAARVGRDHDLHVRFCRTGLHPHRQGERDEQQLVDGKRPRHQSLRRTTAAGLRLLSLRLGESHQIRGRPVHGGCAIRLGNLSQGREGVHAHAGQCGRGQRPAAGAATRRNHAQAPPWHGVPRIGLDHHHAVHEVRVEEIGGLYAERVARDGGGGLGSRAGSGQRERPGADHERGVHGYARDAAQASRDGEGRLAGRRARGGRVLHARYSRYMQRIAEASPELVDELAEVGARFTHHTSIAPTGTISLSLANNASNGIEPSFAHHYFRNVLREGKKSKEKVDVFSFELLAYRELVNPRAMPNSQAPAEKLPDYFIAADDIGPKEHVDIQAAAQLWIDSSISKTANVPTDYKYEDFKDIYMYAFESGAQGLHDIPLQSGSLPGRFGQGGRPEEHHLRLHLGGWDGSRGARRSGDRIRRRNAYRRESLRCAERRLLREVLIMAHIKIGKKIAKYRVQKPEAKEGLPAPKDAPKAQDNVIWMHEKLERPEVLIGSTYKIKTPVSDHAMYVTINDIVLNEGTPHEQRRPFEVFINSKNLDHFQWIVALTRVISAVFPQGRRYDVPGR